ncbi:hypothetical protein [Bosea sp. TND4EK4]|uniref:hypothetical protein n=1 Tax=Bosea sp. TND4EK4 TaxID=1907408 RepID=UPI0009558B79|nr:hypothetical protein [Bosea sp. TND4EK4]SIQ83576.1 hypothetical protein SAMN05880592_10618 [Bosea sp. TND4EK4]
MSKKSEMQRVIRAYKDETENREIEMKEVARWAAEKGWPLPIPKDPLEVLAQQFADAAREETRRDRKTGRHYRANHHYKDWRGGKQYDFWIDIDEAERGPFLKSAVTRREQMVGDGLQLTLDIMHWNSINPEKEPIDLPMDLTFDIELRLNAPDDDDEAA